MKRFLCAMAMLWLIFTPICLFAAHTQSRLPDSTAVTRDTTARSLQDTVFALEEVQINTGYQSVSPERFIGSAVTLDSASFHRRTGMKALDRLKGSVAGVQFGKESSSNTQHRPMVRGISTITSSASAPLIVVDNFPMDERFDLNSISPEDIMDITVLKDAASASVWGALAGNGVIVINTKKGRYGQPLNVSFNSNVRMTALPDLYYYPRMSISDIIDVEKYLFDEGFYNANLNNTSNRPVISPVVEILDQVRRGILDATQAEQEINIFAAQDIRRDLRDNMFRSAVDDQYHLAMRGGTQDLRYSVSMSLDNRRPNLQGADGSQRYNFRSETALRLSRLLQIEAGFSFDILVDKTPPPPILPNIPYLQLQDDRGNALAADRYRSAYLDTVGQGRLLDWHYRPLDEISNAENRNTNRLTQANLATIFSITPWLNGTLRYRYQEQQRHGRSHYNLDTYLTRDLINRFTQIQGSEVKHIIPLGGILDIDGATTLSHHARAQFDVNKRWGSEHQFTGLAAMELSTSAAVSQFATRFYGYNDELETYASGLDYGSFHPVFQRIAGVSSRIPQQTSIGSGITANRISTLVNLSYTYSGRYHLYSSARRDGANAYGVKTNNKWKPLWSVGLGWDISDESFFTTDRVQSLRFRSSFGYMGNTVGGSSGFTTMYYQPIPDEFTGLAWATVGSPPNPSIRWEEVRVWNTGLDFSLMANRISGNIEAFHKRTRDMVSSLPFDPTTGVNLFMVNAAQLKGSGAEMTVNSRNLIGKFSWHTDLGHSYAKTVVTRLYGGRFSAADFILHGVNASEGRVVHGLSSYRWAGLDPLTGDPRGFLDGELSINYQAIAADSVGNQVFHGSSLPLHSGFLKNTFRYRGFSLSANITYGLDYYFRKPTIAYWGLFNQWTGHADYGLRWQQPGDERDTNVPSMTYPADSRRDNFYVNSELHVLRGDHIRLQDIHLQYEVGRRWLQRLSVKRLMLSLYANDLRIMLWRKNHVDLDPDFLTQSSYTAYPTPSSWTFRLHMNF